MSQVNLKKVVFDKIVELGSHDEAAKFFGVQPQTVKMWIKTKNIPISAVEKAMEEPPAVEELNEVPEIPEEVFADSPETEVVRTAMPDMSEYNRVIGEIIQALDQFNSRLSVLEAGGTPAMLAQRPPSMPIVGRGTGIQWSEAEPKDSNARSMVRPAGTVIARFPAAPDAAAVRRDPNAPKPSDSWLKPRKPANQ